MMIVNTTSRYEYTPLHQATEGSPSIRIFELDPVGKGDEDTVSGRLLPTELSIADPYEAVSYAWGKCAADCIVKLDDERNHLHIRPNLHKALKSLRLPDKSRRLWVDAICINQDAESDGIDGARTEKTEQVRHMGQIYHNAEQVLAWLEDEKPERPEIVQLLSKVRSTFAEGKKLSVEELKLLWTVPYFRRRWIIQEIAVARRVILNYGPLSFRWWELENVLPPVIEENHTPLEAILHVRDPGFRTRRGILWHLEEFAKSDCDDPKDRVASMLGLQDDDRKIEYQVSYDLNVSVEDVCFDLATKLVPLGYAHVLVWIAANQKPVDGDSNSSLPSWVPDWRNTFPSSQRVHGHCGFDRIKAHGRVVGRKIEIRCRLIYQLNRDWEAFDPLLGESLTGRRGMPLKGDVMADFWDPGPGRIYAMVVLRPIQEPSTYALVQNYGRGSLKWKTWYGAFLPGHSGQWDTIWIV